MKSRRRQVPLIVAISVGTALVVGATFVPIWAKLPVFRSDIFAPLDTFWGMLDELIQRWREGNANVRRPKFLLMRYWTNIVLAPAILAIGAALGWLSHRFLSARWSDSDSPGEKNV